jgi:hypothetical protein
MLGRDGSRNSVSTETGGPTLWCPEERRRKNNDLIRRPRGIRWTAPLGSQSFSSPVVSGGLVWIGTNNVRPGVKEGEEFAISQSVVRD